MTNANALLMDRKSRKPLFNWSFVLLPGTEREGMVQVRTTRHEPDGVPAPNGGGLPNRAFKFVAQASPRKSAPAENAP